MRNLEQHEKEITIPKHGDTFKLGGAEVKILGPIKPSENLNNTSIVMRLVYDEISVLFMGDAERELEQDILAEGYELSSDVLLVGHHGGGTSTTYPFLREVMPRVAVISVGRLNSYGHPEENMLSRLRDAEARVFRTDMQGMITLNTDGKELRMTAERNLNAETNPNERSAATQRVDVIESRYIGNSRSRRLHRPSCSAAGDIAVRNRVIFRRREIAFEQGYSPCSLCRP